MAYSRFKNEREVRKTIDYNIKDLSLGEWMIAVQILNAQIRDYLVHVRKDSGIDDALANDL